MEIKLPIVRKSSIQGLILKARTHERKLAETEFSERHNKDIQEIRGLYELKLQESAAEIEMLNRVIEKNNALIREAHDKEIQAKKIYLKAMEIVQSTDFEYNRHLESTARTKGNFAKIREDAEIFARKMIGDK